MIIVARSLALLVSVATAVLVYLLAIDELFLTSFNPAWRDIAPVAVLQFVLVSGLLLSMTMLSKKTMYSYAKLAWPLKISSAVLLITVAVFCLVSLVVDRQPLSSRGADYPSLATEITFLVLALAGVTGHKRIIRLILSCLVFLVSLGALLGYATATPLLFFSVPGASQGMSLVAALLFMLSSSVVILMTVKWRYYSGG